MVNFMKKFPNGSATIELMIALAVLATMLATAAAVSYGNFAMTMDSEQYQKGLYEVSSNLEWGRAELTKDINSTVTPPSGVTYQTISDCARQITSTKTWTAGPRTQHITQMTKVVSPSMVRALPGCALTPPSGSGWDCPLSGSFVNISPDIEPTAIDVVDLPVVPAKRLAYVTSIKKNAEVFVIYDVTNGDTGGSLPAPLGTITGPNNNTAGYYDIAAVWAPDGSSAYAYAVGRDPAEHLRIIDIYNSPFTSVVKTLPLTSNNTNALSVAYVERLVAGIPKKILYIGTQNNSVGAEFYAVDVTTPLTAAIIGTPLEIGGDVNAIVVTNDNHVYLATNSNSAELMALNVNNLSAIVVQSFNQSPDQPGKSLYKVGDRLYFGREDENSNDSNNDFLIFNIVSRMAPAFITGAEISGDVNGLVVAGDLAFLSTDTPNSEMKVRRGMLVDAICNFSDTQLSNKGVALDYEGDRVYMLASGGSTDLKIYRPNPVACATPPPSCP
jgi:Tfp pilus assembly protein PilE